MKNNLIIVDVQNGFTNSKDTDKLVPRLEQLLKADVFDVVVATKFKNQPGSHYEKFLGWDGLQTSEEQEIRAEILPFIDAVIEKDTYNCVTDGFADVLRDLNDGGLPDVVCVVGADTDCCVQIISAALFDHRIRPIVLGYYCESNGGEKSHKAGILTLTRTIGENAVISGEITCRDQLKS